MRDGSNVAAVCQVISQGKPNDFCWHPEFSEGDRIGNDAASIHWNAVSSLARVLITALWGAAMP